MTRHDLDLFSLLSGLVLTGIAVAALFDVGIDVGAWVWPTVLIAVGVVILGTVLSSGGGNGDTDPAAVTDGASGPGRDPREGVLADARAEVDRVDHAPDQAGGRTSD